MLCKKCNIPMIPGTTYESNKRGISSRRFDECPKCHFRKYNNGNNVQERVERLAKNWKWSDGHDRGNDY